jgi:hypothetical protein
MRRIPLILTALLLLAGCQSEEVQTSAGQTHSRLDPSVVKLYIDTPRKYEVLGDLEIRENLQYGPDKSVDAVMNKLIHQAADKGANGVLLAITSPGGNGKYATYGGFYQGVFVQFVVRLQPTPEAVIAKAIYVIDE